jgi:succinoglycan biosynthesis transport protein ExoP
MSKNYELLQQASFGLGTARTSTTEQRSVAAEDVTSASSEVLTSLEPGIREETLKLVQRLFLTREEVAPKAVLFAPIDISGGCGWLCSVAAKLLAKSVAGSVCLVEGNFRSPSLSESFGGDRDRGLFDSLDVGGSIKQFARSIGPDNLWLLSAGAPVQDFTILLSSDRLRDRFVELREEFDYLVVNAPPLSAFADGMVLGRMVDGVVLVLEADATRREVAVRVTEGLRNSRIPILGAVLNNRTFPIPAAMYKRL